MMVVSKPDAVLEVKRPCLCKHLHVVETGATASQLEYIAGLDVLRQQAGITAAMLRDGRAAAMVRGHLAEHPADDDQQVRDNLERLLPMGFTLHNEKDHGGIDWPYYVSPQSTKVGPICTVE